MAGEDEQREDRPQELPAVQSAVDPKEARKRKNAKDYAARVRREWFVRQLQDPLFRKFVWDILAACGTFEERYGFGPTGVPHDEATWAYRGQKDLGLRFFNSWLVEDPVGMQAVLFEYHPQFPKDGR